MTTEPAQRQDNQADKATQQTQVDQSTPPNFNHNPKKDKVKDSKQQTQPKTAAFGANSVYGTQPGQPPHQSVFQSDNPAYKMLNLMQQMTSCLYELIASQQQIQAKNANQPSGFNPYSPNDQWQPQYRHFNQPPVFPSVPPYPLDTSSFRSFNTPGTPGYRNEEPTGINSMHRAFSDSLKTGDQNIRFYTSCTYTEHGTVKVGYVVKDKKKLPLVSLYTRAGNHAWSQTVGQLNDSEFDSAVMSSNNKLHITGHRRNQLNGLDTIILIIDMTNGRYSIAVFDECVDLISVTNEIPLSDV